MSDLSLRHHPIGPLRLGSDDLDLGRCHTRIDLTSRSPST